MRSVVGIVGLVFALCGFAFGQASTCPTLTVDGPGGIANPGQAVTFTATVDSKVEIPNLEYTWTLSKGIIVSGENTHVISVKLPEDDPYYMVVDATVTITGFPEACPNTGSARYSVVIDRAAMQLDEFVGPLARISKQRFKKVVDAIKADESSQLFVFIYGNERTRKRSFTQRRAFIIEKMKKAGIDPTRVTFEFSMHSFQYHKEMVILWLVPAGVSNPMP